MTPGESRAQAAACSLAALTATDQTGPKNTSLDFGFQLQGGCGPLVNVVATINPPDNTGGATVTPAGNFDVPPLTATDITVTLGPNPGQSGTVTLSCPTGGCNNAIVYTFRTSNEFNYNNATLSNVVTNQIRNFTVATSLILNGAPATLASSFNNITDATAYGQRPANASGVSTLTENIAAAGNYVVRANIACPTAFVLEGCASVPPVDFNVLVEAVSLDPVTPLAVTTIAGNPETLTVSYGSASFPGPTGTPITWVVASQPAGGDGSVTGSNLLGGESDAVFDATVPGTYTVQASVVCAACAVNTRTFAVTVAPAPLPFTLVATSANPAAGTVGVAQTFSVQLEQGGVPVPAATIDWTASAAPFGPASASSTTDVGGNASAGFTPSVAGNFPAALTAVFDPDGVPASGDEVSLVFDANIAAVPGLAISSGDGQQTLPGQAFAQALVVQADDSGLPAAGVGIDWTVTGDAVVSPGGPTDGSGQASATVVAGTTPGPVTVTATRQDAPAVSVTFNLTTNAAPFTLVATSANPASGTVGVAQAFSVQLQQGGVPVPGANISWTAIAPFAPASAAGTTDAAGESSASFTPSAAGNFVGAVTALFDPDGIAANGDEISVAFGASVAAVPGLAIDSGDGQSAPPGAAFDAPLVVVADNSGVPAAGVVVVWTVTGDASVLAGAPTDASGRTSATVTAGTSSGPFVVTATRQDAPAASVSFSLSVDAPGTLQVVSGDSQLLEAGVQTAPLVVRLLDAGGTPVAGASIAWTSSNGSLDAATTTTDANGETSNLLTPDANGGSEVTASSPLAQEPAVFLLKGSLSSLPGLGATAQEVAGAVDSLCPALAALPTRNAGQQDLLDRCRELQDAAAIDPVSTALALDQLMADVALAQANAAFAAAQSQFQNLRARIAALRSGTQGTDFGGLALTTPQGLFSMGLMAQALGDEDPVPMEVGADFSRWGFFASGTLGRGEVEPGQVDPAYDTDIEGISAGVDYRFSDRLILGGALGLTRQDTTLPGGRGEVETSGWSVSGYTTFYQPDSWYMDGVLTWGRNDYDLLRTIRYTLPLAGGGTQEIDQRAASASEGDLLSMAVTFGRDYNRGAWGLGPYGRLLFTRLDFDVIEESLQPGPGSGLGLRIEQRELESLASVLGGKLTYTHSTGWGVLMPHLQLEWEHEFRDDPQALEARFLNDPTGSAILLRGDELDTDYFRIGLGMSMVLTKGRSGFFYYEHLMGKDRSSQYNLALGFRMEF